MPEIDLHLDGDGAWKDLEHAPPGTVIRAGEKIGMAGLAGGMASGRASVALRIDLPDGRVVFTETSLRTLFSAMTALVAHHGEPWMRERLQGSAAPSDDDRKRALALAVLIRQVAALQKRLGERPTIDLREADAAFDRERGLRQQLARAAAMLRAGESATPADLAAMEAALAG